MTTKTPDDLEAVRTIADTLQAFATDDRERIIRWAREKLGMPVPSPEPLKGQGTYASGTPTVPRPAEPPAHPPAGGADIKTFVSQKNPGSDTHFAATVAFYYQFMAPQSARKASISKDDLIDACRKVDRKRPASPAQVLVNAYHEGILDRAEKGQYKLNSVGENLVAMVLPGATETKRTKASSNKSGGKVAGSRKRPKRPGRG